MAVLTIERLHMVNQLSVIINKIISITLVQLFD